MNNKANNPKKFKRIGIITSGGDAPGMNAALRAVTRSAIERGVEVMGIYEGYKGLMNANMKLFIPRDVSNIINHGGTILYSARCPEFIKEEGIIKAVNVCRENNIDGIIAIGGDGTFRGATDLTNYGIPCIGIPGTIDNDITSTDYSIGYDTAMNTVIEMVDRLRDTCESHCRCNVVEVMGRNSGYIALNTGIAVGALVVIVKEVPFNEKDVVAQIVNGKNKGKRNFIIMVSEGAAEPVDGVPYAEYLTKKIEELTGIETRFARLAHVVRGGAPSLRDRVMASKMGVAAVDLLLEGKSNLVVCIQNDQIKSVDINYALILDRMYKGKLKDGDLNSFTPEQIAKMEDFCTNKRRDFEELYNVASGISK